MRIELVCILASAVFLGGCLTGNSYPAERARTLCDSLFTCVDPDEVEFWTRYDSVEECVAEERDLFEDSAGYESFLDGDCPFDADKAKRCLEEISEVKSDSDCDGNMSFLVFVIDIADDDCAEVYCD
jgi:hypothetical protein